MEGETKGGHKFRISPEGLLEIEAKPRKGFKGEIQQAILFTSIGTVLDEWMIDRGYADDTRPLTEVFWSDEEFRL